MKKYEILLTLEFEEWEDTQTKKSQSQIDDRLAAIAAEGHFGDHKSVSDDDSVWELRWANGRRVSNCSIKYGHILTNPPILSKF